MTAAWFCVGRTSGPVIGRIGMANQEDPDESAGSG
jgi:hypothetical protein